MKQELVKAYLEARLKRDYEGEALKIAEEYFEDNVGMQDMSMDIVESRGQWYFVNTDPSIMLIQPITQFVDKMIDQWLPSEAGQEWAEEYFDNHTEEIKKELMAAF